MHSHFTSCVASQAAFQCLYKMKAIFVALVISFLVVCSLGDDGAAEFVVRQANQAQDRCRCWLRGTTPCPGPPPPGPPPPGCTESPSSSPTPSPSPKTSPAPSPTPPKTSPAPSPFPPKTSPAPSPSPPKTSPAPSPTPKATPKASGGKDHYAATP
ncbi:alpha carbonic anhydrase 8-like isoform X1 [Selaginella moellendorffii]|uniref:alpha carbonic anhydrase 8-like isoform X1 n=1 Tax=Selaginella moellendorffii TaxID=88036 RepID=UPI000D1C8BAC|nr:alpha carbonic anhydrase 8-like isoform X1 [Selaginella moellendorffii]|eukprot:XP_024538195.1 alpha carbonic anhydrase 8-like isoform X1 [Selaginella moellendorffii]